MESLIVVLFDGQFPSFPHLLFPTPWLDTHVRSECVRESARGEESGRKREGLRDRRVRASGRKEGWRESLTVLLFD